MNKLIFLGFFLVIFSCATPRYLFVDSDILRQEIAGNGGMPVKRYILSPDNFPTDSMTFLNDEPTKSFLNILKSNNPKKILRYIQSAKFSEKADSLSKPFCLALYYFIASKYDSCLIEIKHLNNISKTCFVKFLITDCEFETKQIGNHDTFEKYIEGYQKILDCNDNQLSKEIVKNRVKLIRYGY